MTTTETIQQIIIEKGMSMQKYLQYRARIYDFLLELSEDTKVKVNDIVKKENKQLFTQTVILYYEEGMGDITFSEDYEVFVVRKIT